MEYTIEMPDFTYRDVVNNRYYTLYYNKVQFKNPVILHNKETFEEKEFDNNVIFESMEVIPRSFMSEYKSDRLEWGKNLIITNVKIKLYLKENSDDDLSMVTKYFFYIEDQPIITTVKRVE